MTYAEFYAECNRFIDMLDKRAAEFADECQRMKTATLKVMCFAQERERRREPFA